MRFLRLRYFVAAAIAVFVVWFILQPARWQNWLGFSHDAYFKTGQNYAFYSGVGAMLATTLGLSTVVVALLRHINCHVAGCPRIGKHKVANGEFGVCGRHWREINGQPNEHKFTVAHIREHHLRHKGEVKPVVTVTTTHPPANFTVTTTHPPANVTGSSGS